MQLSKSKKSMPEIVNEVYVLLEPLGSEQRGRIVASALTLLGDNPIAPPSTSGRNGGSSEDESKFGPKAKRWMAQNDITTSQIEDVFHCEGNSAEVIANQIPGSGKRGQTHNCYLLVGIQSLLSIDDPKFSDSDALKLCKDMGCHDAANHAKNRSTLGNIVAGSKASGYTLPAPGLRAAAVLVKAMSSSN